MIEPFVVFAGSKFKLLPQLLPLFPPASRFVDLFAGGGSVYSNVCHRYDRVLANDRISDLMEIQRRIIADPEKVLADLEQIRIERDDQVGYVELRRQYNDAPTPEKLLMLMLCCTNNLMRFNKQLKFNQTFGRRTMSEVSKAKIKIWAQLMKPHQEKIEFSALPFEEVKIQERDFVFCDPPYESSEAGYNAYWGKDNGQKLFEFLKSADGRGIKFMLCGFERHGEKTSPLLEAMAGVGFVRTAIVSDYEKVSRSRRSKETQEVVYTNYKTEQV